MSFKKKLQKNIKSLITRSCWAAFKALPAANSPQSWVGLACCSVGCLTKRALRFQVLGWRLIVGFHAPCPQRDLVTTSYFRQEKCRQLQFSRFLYVLVPQGWWNVPGHTPNPAVWRGLGPSSGNQCWTWRGTPPPSTLVCPNPGEVYLAIRSSLVACCPGPLADGSLRIVTGRLL